MSKLFELFDQTKRLLQQQREIEALRAEVEKQQLRNDRMSEAMRRCITCEYRLTEQGLRWPR